jgi:hypothetical protein
MFDMSGIVEEQKIRLIAHDPQHPLKFQKSNSPRRIKNDERRMFAMEA